MRGQGVITLTSLALTCLFTLSTVGRCARAANSDLQLHPNAAEFLLLCLGVVAWGYTIHQESYGFVGIWSQYFLPSVVWYPLLLVLVVWTRTITTFAAHYLLPASALHLASSLDVTGLGSWCLGLVPEQATLLSIIHSPTAIIVSAALLAFYSAVATLWEQKLSCLTTATEFLAGRLITPSPPGDTICAEITTTDPAEFEEALSSFTSTPTSISTSSHIHVNASATAANTFSNHSWSTSQPAPFVPTALPPQSLKSTINIPLPTPLLAPIAQPPTAYNTLHSHSVSKLRTVINTDPVTWDLPLNVANLSSAPIFSQATQEPVAAFSRAGSNSSHALKSKYQELASRAMATVSRSSAFSQAQAAPQTNVASSNAKPQLVEVNANQQGADLSSPPTFDPVMGMLSQRVSNLSNRPIFTQLNTQPSANSGYSALDLEPSVSKPFKPSTASLNAPRFSSSPIFSQPAPAPAAAVIPSETNSASVSDAYKGAFTLNGRALSDMPIFSQPTLQPDAMMTSSVTNTGAIMSRSISTQKDVSAQPRLAAQLTSRLVQRGPSGALSSTPDASRPDPPHPHAAAQASANSPSVAPSSAMMPVALNGRLLSSTPIFSQTPATSQPTEVPSLSVATPRPVTASLSRTEAASQSEAQSEAAVRPSEIKANPSMRLLSLNGRILSEAAQAIAQPDAAPLPSESNPPLNTSLKARVPFYSSSPIFPRATLQASPARSQSDIVHPDDASTPLDTSQAGAVKPHSCALRPDGESSQSATRPSVESDLKSVSQGLHMSKLSSTPFFPQAAPRLSNASLHAEQAQPGNVIKAHRGGPERSRSQRPLSDAATLHAEIDPSSFLDLWPITTPVGLSNSSSIRVSSRTVPQPAVDSIHSDNNPIPGFNPQPAERGLKGPNFSNTPIFGQPVSLSGGQFTPVFNPQAAVRGVKAPSFSSTPIFGRPLPQSSGPSPSAVNHPTPVLNPQAAVRSLDAPQFSIPPMFQQPVPIHYAPAASSSADNRPALTTSSLDKPDPVYNPPSAARGLNPPNFSSSPIFSRPAAQPHAVSASSEVHFSSVLNSNPTAPVPHGPSFSSTPIFTQFAPQSSAATQHSDTRPSSQIPPQLAAGGINTFRFSSTPMFPQATLLADDAAQPPSSHHTPVFTPQPNTWAFNRFSTTPIFPRLAPQPEATAQRPPAHPSPPSIPLPNSGSLNLFSSSSTFSQSLPQPNAASHASDFVTYAEPTAKGLTSSRLSSTPIFPRHVPQPQVAPLQPIQAAQRSEPQHFEAAAQYSGFQQSEPPAQHSAFEPSELADPQLQPAVASKQPYRLQAVPEEATRSAGDTDSVAHADQMVTKGAYAPVSDSSTLPQQAAKLLASMTPEDGTDKPFLIAAHPGGEQQSHAVPQREAWNRTTLPAQDTKLSFHSASFSVKQLTQGSQASYPTPPGTPARQSSLKRMSSALQRQMSPNCLGRSQVVA